VAVAVVEAAVEIRQLQPAVAATQQSAARLVDRMIRLTEPQEQCSSSRGVAATAARS